LPVSCELVPKEPRPTGAALVVDVIRATTTAVAFFEAGAGEVWFAPGHPEALALKARGFLVAGETRGLRPEGFDLGNSPREALALDLSGRRVVMSTTNGTRAARLAARATPRVALGSLWNRRAAARWLEPRLGEGVTLLAAGKEGRFGLDDAYVLGAVASLLPDRDLDDATLAAIRLFEAQPDPLAAIAPSAAARALAAVGLEDDLPAVARMDASPVVPVLDRREGEYLVFVPR